MRANVAGQMDPAHLEQLIDAELFETFTFLKRIVECIEDPERMLLEV